MFQDPGTGGEQPHHFWAYVAYTLKYGSDMARAGNLAHETFLARPYRGALKGRSYQDYALGRQGVSLEVDLIWGALEIDQVGDYISNNLAPGGVAATYWQNASDKIGNYSMLLAIASLIWPIPPGEQGR